MHELNTCTCFFPIRSSILSEMYHEDGVGLLYPPSRLDKDICRYFYCSQKNGRTTSRKWSYESGGKGMVPQVHLSINGGLGCLLLATHFLHYTNNQFYCWFWTAQAVYLPHTSQEISLMQAFILIFPFSESLLKTESEEKNVGKNEGW